MIDYFISKVLNKRQNILNKKKEIKLKNDLNNIFIKNKVDIKEGYKIMGFPSILNFGTIEIGYDFQANSGVYHNEIGGDTLLRLIAYTKQAKIIIGNNVGISNSSLVSWNKIEIEDNVMIGGSVKIWDTDFHSLDPYIRTNTSDFEYDVKTKPILIKENAFIGASSIILKGVTIGKNSIIGAGSVVTKQIPDNVIACGNPCRVIKNLNYH